MVILPYVGVKSKSYWLCHPTFNLNRQIVLSLMLNNDFT